MSYILDALKKSEKERRRMLAPDQLTMQDAVLYERKRRSLWPYLIIVALLVNAAVFALWFDLRSKRPESAMRAISGRPGTSTGEKSSLSVTAESKAGQLTESIKGRETAPSEAAVADSASNVRQARPGQVEENAKKRTRASQEIPLEDGKRHVVRGVSSKEMTAAGAQTERKPDNIVLSSPNRIYNLSELPLTIRQNLPEVLISVFLYSDDPASRLVRVNGQMLREGQYLNEGLKLEQIVPGGVIFSYQNFRFLVGPK